MKRVLEPELMEDEAQVLAYAQADFSRPHDDFIQRIKLLVGGSGFSGKALDLGCGPGDVTRRFAEAFPGCSVDAVDGSKAMIDCAVKMTNSRLLTRLQYFYAKLPDEALPTASYGLIFSNSLLHHLPDPMTLWYTIKKYAKPNTLVFVMDLLRPCSLQDAKTIVELYAAEEPEILRHDFYHSLLAAFTLDEVKDQLKAMNLPLSVQQTSDRHLFIHGIFF